MENNINQDLVNLGLNLTTLAVKGTVSRIATKIKTIKDEKNIEKVRSAYDEIITDLLHERDEAVLIAQSYKSELDRIVISGDDIIHLHNTIARILDVLSENNGNFDPTLYNQVKELINIDTLKTMQLHGFNYKAAIGEPLTKLCADKISSFITN
jgi:superfamily I DNA and/or RNA helicase